jgi:hypothetical protein
MNAHARDGRDRLDGRGEGVEMRDEPSRESGTARRCCHLPHRLPRVTARPISHTTHVRPPRPLARPPCHHVFHLPQSVQHQCGRTRLASGCGW